MTGYEYLLPKNLSFFGYSEKPSMGNNFSQSCTIYHTISEYFKTGADQHRICISPSPFLVCTYTYPNLFEQLTRPITSIVSSSQTIALLIVFLPLFFMSAASKSKSYEHLIDFMTSFCTTTINFETRLVRGV